MHAIRRCTQSPLISRHPRRDAGDRAIRFPAIAAALAGRCVSERLIDAYNYWSSSEDGSSAYNLNFNSGNQNTNSKDSNTNCLRACRRSTP